MSLINQFNYYEKYTNYNEKIAIAVNNILNSNSTKKSFYVYEDNMETIINEILFNLKRITNELDSSNYLTNNEKVSQLDDLTIIRNSIHDDLIKELSSKGFIATPDDGCLKIRKK